MNRFQGPLRAPFTAVLLQAAPASRASTAEAADISGFVRDAGPIFHVDGGVGVFGSYAADGFRLFAEKGEDGNMKITPCRRSPPWPETPP
ncbi:MAG: hypothetical protein OXH50_19305 [Gemmatimonadetes bacterium]|nr:hypothetical protein [Gemmatimonadota bacterium]